MNELPQGLTCDWLAIHNIYYINARKCYGKELTQKKGAMRHYEIDKILVSQMDTKEKSIYAEQRSVLIKHETGMEKDPTEKAILAHNLIFLKD